MSSSLNLAITGASGRMGRRLIALASASSDFRIVGALVRNDHPDIGADAGEVAGVGAIGVKLASSLDVEQPPHVVIDFSSVGGFRHWIKVAHHRHIPLLVGTTGLTPTDHQLIDQAALAVPILQATNTSMGVAVLNHVAARMAEMLGAEFDIEIVETHHRHKKDHPSGTALTLADRILGALGKTRDSLHIGRGSDDGAREPGQIGLQSLRMGDVTGTHSVHFASDGERLEVTHVATHRDVFARGALRAAAWLAGRGAGRYQIEDVLGLGARGTK